MTNLILDRGGRVISSLIFVFWTVFFIEHLSEWFLRSDGQLPPLAVWMAQVFHLGMLAALIWSIFQPLRGSVAIVVASAVFFGFIQAFPTIAMINLVPLAIAGLNRLLTRPIPSKS